jgi:predicted nucleic acid-binding protein
VTAYVDASVLLRVALGQPDSLPDWKRIDRGVSSALIVTECLRTLDRLKLRAGLPDSEVATRRATILSLVASLEIVEIDSVILNRAAQPMPTELGTLDAIHLATAILWKESTRTELVMATHDLALALGAQAHGLDIVGVSRR